MSDAGGGTPGVTGRTYIFDQSAATEFSSNTAAQFGQSTDIITPGDYTGDGKTDIAVFNPSTGEWFVQRSEDNSYFSFFWGQAGDIPAPGDYDGNGIADATVFRPSTVNWYSSSQTQGAIFTTFGANTDRPVPGAFVP